MKVFVYRNLHKSCLSVRSVKTGRVIAHVDSIVLENCNFKVSKSGRARVLREKRKNVHAGVEGTWVQGAKVPDTSQLKRVIYDPYKFESFVLESNHNPVFVSDRAFVTIEGAYVVNFE